MRKTTTTLTLATVALLMSSCGFSASSAPKDASKEDFCNVFIEAGDVKTGEDARNWADDVVEVGTPADLSDEGREGFEITMEYVADIDQDVKDVEEEPEPDYSDSEQKKVDAFSEYAGATCMGQLMEEMAPAE